MTKPARLPLTTPVRIISWMAAVTPRALTAMAAWMSSFSLTVSSLAHVCQKTASTSTNLFSSSMPPVVMRFSAR